MKHHIWSFYLKRMVHSTHETAVLMPTMTLTYTIRPVELALARFKWNKY